MHKLSSFACAALLFACGGALSPERKIAMASQVEGSFAHDLAFLQRHTEVIVLTSEDKQAQVAVAPQYQGRVMTSTAKGEAGASFGYVHRAGITAGTKQPHMTVLGGEDRFWLGPEGGQFALYFAATRVSTRAPSTIPNRPARTPQIRI
jgi:hypothetical protein